VFQIAFGRFWHSELAANPPNNYAMPDIQIVMHKLAFWRCVPMAAADLSTAKIRPPSLLPQAGFVQLLANHRSENDAIAELSTSVAHSAIRRSSNYDCM
jgi:hypothetical protein